MWKMLIKEREPSKELLLSRSLSLRMSPSEKNSNHYLLLEKGYVGELLFDDHLNTLTNDFYLVNDLLLEHGNTLFQLDSLALFQDTLFMFEVKNYEGDFYVKGDRWYTGSDIEIKNPLQQLYRSDALLRRFLQDQGCVIPIEPLLVFVNPEFTLYQAPMKTPIILPTQIPRLLRKLANLPFKSTHLHEKISERLLSHLMDSSPLLKKPEYHYEMLRKGVMCSTCFKFVSEATETKLICKCGVIEGIDEAIIRSVREFILLFPDRLVTTNAIFEWCGGMVRSKRLIRRVLLQNFQRHGNKKSTYFSEFGD
jgi:hypothetical protein